MKLTGILKEQVEKAETKEKKKSLIGGAGMEPEPFFIAFLFRFISMKLPR